MRKNDTKKRDSQRLVTIPRHQAAEEWYRNIESEEGEKMREQDRDIRKTLGK